MIMFIIELEVKVVRTLFIVILVYTINHNYSTYKYVQIKYNFTTDQHHMFNMNVQWGLKYTFSLS